MAKRGKRRGMPCPNCGKAVKYASQHAEGKTGLDLVWTCKKR